MRAEARVLLDLGLGDDLAATAEAPRPGQRTRPTWRGSRWPAGPESKETRATAKAEHETGVDEEIKSWRGFLRFVQLTVKLHGQWKDDGGRTVELKRNIPTKESMLTEKEP